MAESVKVVVRCRPMNQREKDLKCETIVKIDNSKGTCSLVCPEEPNGMPKNFTFDGAYGIESNTESIYNDVGFPLVESVISFKKKTDIRLNIIFLNCFRFVKDIMERYLHMVKLVVVNHLVCKELPYKKESFRDLLK